MKRIQLIQTHLPRIVAPALVALPAACAPQPQATPAATPAATAAPPTAEAQPPAADGRLLVNTEQGLWMGLPDGSEAALRIPGRVRVQPGPLSGAVSSADGLVAYLTASDPSSGDNVENIVWAEGIGAFLAKT